MRKIYTRQCRPNDFCPNDCRLNVLEPKTENKEKSLGSNPRTIDLPMVDVFCNQSWLNALFHRQAKNPAADLLSNITPWLNYSLESAYFPQAKFYWGRKFKSGKTCQSIRNTFARAFETRRNEMKESKF